MKRLSIKAKTAIISIAFMAILTAAIASLGYKLYRDSVMQNYRDLTKTILEYAYRTSVKFSFGDMIAERDMPEGYEEFRSELNSIKESSDIDYLYAIYFEDMNDIHSLHYAINAKTQEELASGKPVSEIYSYMGKPCEEGAFQEDTLKTLWDAVNQSKRTSGTLEGNSEHYGYMLNGYHVIFDKNDRAVGLLCVEIDTKHIQVELKRYIRMTIFIASVLTTLIILIYMYNAQRYFIQPIMQIKESSDSFIKKMQSNTDPENLTFDEVQIRSHGELHKLAENVKCLSNSVAAYMTNLKSATAERERINTELSLATEIQTAMLPHIFPPFPDRHEFDIFALSEPAREVGGDFYDFFLIDKDHLGLVMADVSGKGIPAALFMMASKIILQSCAKLGIGAADILTKTNESISTNNQAEMFVTVWIGILDIPTGKLTCANAGHEYPALKKADGTFELFKDKHGLAVGGMEGIRYKEYTLQLEKGDKLFLYTDGVPEASDAENNMFGTGRMLSALNTEPDADPKTLLQNVRGAVSKFVRNAEQFDDLTMLCIEYKGEQESQD